MRPCRGCTGSDEFDAEAGERAFDVRVGVVELERAFGMAEAFLLHDGAEQLFLVLEIDVESALGDAGRFGDVHHAGGVETAGQEDRAGALHDLTPFRIVLIRLGRRGAEQFGEIDHGGHAPLRGPASRCSAAHGVPPPEEGDITNLALTEPFGQKFG